ncbi:MAG TPA: hypothetical protein VKA54_12975 [Gemmatimonadaceae bacterium]|nr:hypothetical protein [Gemmatimonadaceae bacterium]
MITFGPMPTLVLTHPAALRPPPSSRRARALAILATLYMLTALAPPLGAQRLSHTEDAIPIPGGWLRFTVGNAWTRYDSRFGENGTTIPLGAELSTDSLGPRELPRMAPIEGALQTLTNNPAQRLTFGRLEVQSDARIVTTPFALEYGVTRRFSIGVLVPMVQTRRTAHVRVNQRATGDTTKTSNVGILPVAGRATAATNNAALVTSLAQAAASLTGLLTRCAQNPAAVECNAVRGKEADATAAAKRASDFAGAVATAYGITPQTAVVAPLENSQLAKTIEAQRAALAAQLATYLPGTTISPLGTVATTEFSYVDLQGRDRIPGLLGSTLGGGLDSIATTERIALGDVEVRARVLLIDRTQRDSLPTRGAQVRLAVGGIARFATSRPDTARNLVDIGTGEGAGAEVRSVLDVAAKRVGATIAARYAKSFARTVTVPLVGYPTGGFPYPEFGEVSRTFGDVFGLDVTPRVFVGDWLAFEGQYGMERIGAPTFTGPADSPCSACVVTESSILPTETTVQRLGLGVRYSTVDSFLRGRARYPIEVSYRHLETITGDAGTPKDFRDQLQLRIYYRVRRQRQ